MRGPSEENALVLDGGALEIEAVEDVARRRRRIELAPQTAAALDSMRDAVARCARADDPIYGVNTGFGSLSRVRIAPDQVREVQRNLIRSHAAGVGESLGGDVVRAMMVILAASLGRGISGVRSALVQQIIEMLNADLTPIVPSRGSVGASGDLAPLAHIALVLIGEGECRIGDDPRVVSGADGLRGAGMQPIALEAKEGLALINGTHMMCALAALAAADLERLFDAAVASAAMAVDACRASDEPLDARLHEARKQVGQIHVATRMRELLSGSQIIPAHKDDDPRVQDPYCLRATPQVLGAVHDALAHARGIIERELGGVTDNPLIFTSREGGLEFLSGGNFHGMPLAIALDSMAIAICHLAGIAERRINWLLTASDSENPVNPYLSPQPGLHSGLMIAQYTAAACCNELQTLATPAGVANIPTSAGIEDYNSMGATSALQLARSVDLATHVIAIELMVMAEALEYQRPLRSGSGVEHVHDVIRAAVPRLTEDRPPAYDITRICALVRDGAIH